MIVLVASWLVYAAGIYLLIGLLVGIPFAFFGVNKIDPSAREGTVGFRLLIIPGSVALWPVVARRWYRGGPPQAECNAHRDAARKSAAP